jgi:hypothetical protein
MAIENQYAIKNDINYNGVGKNGKINCHLPTLSTNTHLICERTRYPLKL